MKPKVKVKAFLEALTTINENHEDIYKYANDKRISGAERKIINCWALLSQNKFTDILEILSSLPTQENDLVEAQKNLLWGITHNNKTDFVLALEKISLAIPTLEHYQIVHQQFIGYYNLFVVGLNLKKKSIMDSSMNNMQLNVHLFAKGARALKLCQFLYSSFLQDHEKCCSLIEELNHLAPNMPDSMQVAYWQNQFYFYLKMEQFDECEEVLIKLKHKKNFSHGANYKYMKMLLAHLLHQKAIYAYEDSFKDFPYFYYQIKVIQSMEGGNWPQALHFWNLLAQISPEIYQENFDYRGEKTLFSLCLQKYEKENIPSIALDVAGLKKEDILILFLKNSTVPLNKEDLYLKIWGQAVESKSDLSKLQKMVNRLRDKGYEISYQRDCYKLMMEKKAS